MGWDISEKGFHIVLSPEVPDTVTKHLGKDVDDFLAEQGVKRSDIKSWVMHTGGPKVLEATATGAGHHGKRSGSFLEVFAQGRQHFFDFRTAGSGGRVHASAPRPWRAEHSCRDGAGFCAEMVLLRWYGGGG